MVRRVGVRRVLGGGEGQVEHSERRRMNEWCHWQHDEYQFHHAATANAT